MSAECPHAGQRLSCAHLEVVAAAHQAEWGEQCDWPGESFKSCLTCGKMSSITVTHT